MLAFGTAAFAAFGDGVDELALVSDVGTFPSPSDGLRDGYFRLQVFHVSAGGLDLLAQLGASGFFPGNPVALSVTANGTGPLFYQWLRDGIPVAGATNQVLALSSVRPADAGTYRAQVRNAAGMATSAAALLQVQGQLTAPTILSVSGVRGTVEVTFSTSYNTRCVVEYRAEAEAGPWSVLTTVTGTGAAITVVDSNPSSARRFYRVREE